jgi:hypothetical protein
MMSAQRAKISCLALAEAQTLGHRRIHRPIAHSCAVMIKSLRVFDSGGPASRLSSHNI